MEQGNNIREVDAQHVSVENRRREELGMGMIRILSRSYDSVLGQLDAEYRLRYDTQARDNIPYSVPGQQMLKISE